MGDAMKRVILVIIDSLGVGAMDDVAEVRSQDMGANTFKHILDQAERLEIPNLERLGINQILMHPRLSGDKQLGAVGVLNLAHAGADSYMGHQEIMGTKPKKPLLKPFSYFRDEVITELTRAGHRVSFPEPDKPYILVDDRVVVADNIETDYGQIYNVSAPLDEIDFEEVLAIARIVRAVVKVNRVIALGGRGVSREQLLGSIETRADGLTGVNSPKSGVYKKGYVSRHLGYGVDPQSQISSILARRLYTVTLVGKMQDVIECEGAVKIPAVETTQVMEEIYCSLDRFMTGLVAGTVQETDLAGHAQNVDTYAEKLMIVDEYLGKIMEAMLPGDLLLVSADHGNDPTIGFSQHTREKTFVLAYGQGIRSTEIGERETLSDLAATIADYFAVEEPENGTSFLHLIT
jgi:phosphopentomutase